MKENIKIALMALIAVTLIINTFMKDSGSEPVRNNKTVADRGIQAITPANNENASPEIVANEPIQTNAGPQTIVVFDEYDFDFGDIKQETENEKVFKFTNVGKEPLIITNAKGSCGCTVPEYPKEPIEPGATGEIKVVYSPGKQQYKQTKSVTITANTDPETTVLKIYANVIPTGDQQPS